jgi:hypothetical protein
VSERAPCPLADQSPEPADLGIYEAGGGPNSLVIRAAEPDLPGIHRSQSPEQTRLASVDPEAAFQVPSPKKTADPAARPPFRSLQIRQQGTKSTNDAVTPRLHSRFTGSMSRGFINVEIR